MTPINLAEKLQQFTSHWDPHVIADYNNNEVMVVRFQGEFPFHLHDSTDDFFLVLDGEMMMDLETHPTGSARASFSSFPKALHIARARTRNVTFCS